MKVTIKATNLKLTPAIKRAIKKQIATLDKFIPYIDSSVDETKVSSSPFANARVVEAFVEVALETRHHKKGKIYYTEANIKVPGKIIRAEAKEENLYQAINMVKDELQGSLKKYKKRRVAKKERASRAIKRKWRYSSLIRIKEKGKRIRNE